MFADHSRCPIKIDGVSDHRRHLRSANLSVLITVLSLLLVSACSDSSTSQQPVTPSPEVQSSGESSIVNSVENAAEETSPETPVSQEIAEDDHTDAESAVRYTDSNQYIWPPQPVEISNVSALPFTLSKRSEPDIDLAIKHTIKTQPSTGKLLGERHEILTQHYLTDKSGDVTRIDVQVFNYDTNQVATVEFDANATSVIKTTVKDAHLYQPPESPAEVARAIELAAEDLSRQGFTEHKNLAGTGLLAFPTAVQSAASGADFFSVRKIYVTFGVGKGILPEYRALVNLSTNTVESSGSIQ